MASSVFRPRKHLHADALYRLLRSEFEQLPDPQPTAARISLADALMAGVALYALKDPSLLAFDERRHDDNLRDIYQIRHVPCDTQLRTLLDPVNPFALAPTFRAVFRQLQRGKVLEHYQVFEGCYLLLVDGVEYFCSENISCPKCCQRHLRNGHLQYYHQLLGAVLAHPDRSEVIPLMPEPIQHQDGDTKNDCEQNAAKRLLKRIANEHPHLRLIIVEDSLSSTGPHLQLIRELGHHFMIGVKPGSHAALFARMEDAYRRGQAEVVSYTNPATGIIHHFRYLSQVPLNGTHEELLVNFVEYWEIHPDGRVQHFSWITDWAVTPVTVMPLMRYGRVRWKIENETFNTLKNQGYHFDHNYGHGTQNLSVVFAFLMMLAFLIDQIQQLCDPLFRAVLTKLGSKRSLWEKVRSVVFAHRVRSLRQVLEALYYGFAQQEPERLNSS